MRGRVAKAAVQSALTFEPEFSGELYGLAKGFGSFFGVWAGFFSNHQHFAISTGICGVACLLPASRVDKPLVSRNDRGRMGDCSAPLLLLVYYTFL